MIQPELGLVAILAVGIPLIWLALLWFGACLARWRYRRAVIKNNWFDPVYNPAMRGASSGG